MDRTKHQTYEPWKIGLFPKGRSDVWSLSDSREGLEIDLIFHDADQIVTVKFGCTDAYRVIDEGYRLRQLEHLPLPMEETIYVVSQSDMVKELVDEACGMVDEDRAIHYFIVTDNDCIDIIVNDDCDEPQLKYKNTTLA
jgi:hypothetical protein